MNAQAPVTVTPPAPGNTTVIMSDGSQVNRSEPLIPARTSTKVAVGTGAIAAFPAVELLTWVQGLQLEPSWLESATNSPYFIYYGALLIAWCVARFTKSPGSPQPL